MINKLVFNREAETAFAHLTVNLLPVSTRLDTLEGKEYTVVPMVILTEGVHSGSGGPMLYPKAELSKTPAVWNMKPVVVYHPTMNGEGISACDPVVINSRKVGIMMNTRFEDGKLKSEAWIDVARANAVDERIMVAVKNGEMMELSTGVFVDIDPVEGVHNKKAYSGIACNYRPDHLALLPDQIGACSIADGAGFLRNKAGEKITMIQLEAAVAKMTNNVLSHDDIRMVLSSKLTKRFTNGIQEFPIWVVTVFPGEVIYEHDQKLFRLSYTAKKDVVELGDEPPEEVKERRSYVPVTNETKTENNTMENEKLINGIVGNAEWTEDNRKSLGTMSAAQLQRIHDGIHKKIQPTKAELAANAEAVKVEAAKQIADQKAADEKAAADKLLGNKESKEPKVITLGEYISAAPSQIQEVLNNGVATYNAEKTSIVSTIMANEKNSFTQEELESRPLGELKKMAQLMAPAAASNEDSYTRPNFAGQAPTPAANSAVEEPLTMPVMNFDKK